MNPTERGTRLCLLFEAGPTRVVLEATRVIEVAAPDGASERFRGVHTLHDASVLLGGSVEERPGVVVVLDVSPTLVLRVRRVRGVADMSRATFFQVPADLGEISTTVRGAVLFERELYLEVEADRLSPAKPLALSAVGREPVPLPGWIDRALVFESQGVLYGISLALISQVVPAGEAFCPLPTGKGPVAGLYPHGQALYPIYSVPALRGAGAASRESFFVLTEIAGRSVGLSASRVLGVQGPFTSTPDVGLFRAKGLAGNVQFLDFQRMFC